MTDVYERKLTRKDVALSKPKEKLSQLSPQTKALVAAIEAGEQGVMKKYLNHILTQDPANSWNKVPAHVKGAVYYQPATAKEVKDDNVLGGGIWSGKRRLFYREENGRYAFYLASHPNKIPGLPDNKYGQATVIDLSQ
jgi:hypothetical protein